MEVGAPWQTVLGIQMLRSQVEEDVQAQAFTDNQSPQPLRGSGEGWGWLGAFPAEGRSSRSQGGGERVHLSSLHVVGPCHIPNPQVRANQRSRTTPIPGAQGQALKSPYAHQTPAMVTLCRILALVLTLYGQRSVSPSDLHRSLVTPKAIVSLEPCLVLW